jgi:hypothetical protein
MNQAAYDAVEEAWTLTVKARALCPCTDDSAIGMTRYISPGWYQARGATYVVNRPKALTANDVKELGLIGGFVNRSFVISMAAILEQYDVIPYGADPCRSKKGGNHAQLTKWLRNRFAHGEREYDARNRKHVETRKLLEELFPKAVSAESGFVTSIDGVLEPLKDGVLAYIRSAT